jgi:general secretion pathway protein G
MLLLSGASQAEEPAVVIEKVIADAKITRVKADCMAISSALKTYKINAGHFPTEKQGLAALVKKPADEPRPVDWVQVISRVPKDPWGREYFIRVREKEKRTLVFVVSQGPDPEVAEDDIEHPVDPPKAKE